MPGWFWVLTALLGVLGIGLFGVGYAQADKATRPVEMTSATKALGLTGLTLLAWSVLFMAIGAVIEISQALAR
jgi:hypothetical protein